MPGADCFVVNCSLGIFILIVIVALFVEWVQ